MTRPEPPAARVALLCRLLGHRWVATPCGEPADSECAIYGLRCERCDDRIPGVRKSRDEPARAAPSSLPAL